MSLVRVYQPEKSGLCGQAAVAMLFNTTLDESCKLFGHKHQTWTHDVVRVLRAAGWKVPNKRVTITSRTRPSDPSLINVHFLQSEVVRSKNARHWVVLWEGEMYCGLGWDKKFYENAQQLRLVKFVSFLPLTPP